MTKKEVVDLILSKVDEDKKEALINELREAKTKEERIKVLEKYGVTITAEEAKMINRKELSDQELDDAAGGCSCNCHWYCIYPCM